MNDLLDAAPCGVMSFDDDGRILSANETLARMLGYDKGELKGKSIDTILSVATRIFYSTHFFPLVKLHSRADEIFLTLIDRDRKDIAVLSNTIRREHDGGFENISVFMPLLQRKKFEDEILQAKRVAEDALKENKELQELTRALEFHTQQLEKQNQRIIAFNDDLVQFSKIISHDVQEPIRKIKLFSSILLTSPAISLDERAAAAVARIDVSAQRLSDLTRGLQEYLNIEPVFEPAEVPLDDVFESALLKATKLRNFHDFQVVKGKLPSIEGSAAQLELLFFHLLDNAIQFRKADQPLIIGIEHTLLEENMYRSIQNKYRFVEHVRLIFSDNGIGFDDQYKEYVFDMAKKVHDGAKGLGFGLALIKKIVDIHEGTIRVESEQDKGTHVVIVLPLRKNPGAASTMAFS